jgi:hypothetical protein
VTTQHHEHRMWVMHLHVTLSSALNSDTICESSFQLAKRASTVKEANLWQSSGKLSFG